MYVGAERQIDGEYCCSEELSIIGTTQCNLGLWMRGSHVACQNYKMSMSHVFVTKQGHRREFYIGGGGESFLLSCIWQNRPPPPPSHLQWNGSGSRGGGGYLGWPCPPPQLLSLLYKMCSAPPPPSFVSFPSIEYFNYMRSCYEKVIYRLILRNHRAICIFSIYSSFPIVTIRPCIACRL